MRIRPLIIGSVLAVCFWGVSMLWKGAGAQNGGGLRDGGVVESNDFTYDVLVLFEGEIQKKGQLVIQLYRDAESFSQRKMPFDECLLRLDISDETLWQFRGLPKGEYAIAVFHDVNENSKLDRAEEGIAEEGIKEPFGFSNSAPVAGKLPAFDECAFFLDRNHVVRIKLTE